jgi:DNA-binding transcriptional regulator YdaS (Cro superfamily)
MSDLTGIDQAIRAIGSQAKLAAALGCTQQNISTWLRRGYVPPSSAIAIEQATGVSRALLVDPRIVELLTAGI